MRASTVTGTVQGSNGKIQGEILLEVLLRKHFNKSKFEGKPQEVKNDV